MCTPRECWSSRSGRACCILIYSYSAPDKRGRKGRIIALLLHICIILTCLNTLTSMSNRKVISSFTRPSFLACDARFANHASGIQYLLKSEYRWFSFLSSSVVMNPAKYNMSNKCFPNCNWQIHWFWIRHAIIYIYSSESNKLEWHITVAQYFSHHFTSKSKKIIFLLSLFLM